MINILRVGTAAIAATTVAAVIAAVVAREEILVIVVGAPFLGVLYGGTVAAFVMIVASLFFFVALILLSSRQHRSEMRRRDAFALSPLLAVVAFVLLRSLESDVVIAIWCTGLALATAASVKLTTHAARESSPTQKRAETRTA